MDFSPAGGCRGIRAAGCWFCTASKGVSAGGTNGNPFLEEELIVIARNDNLTLGMLVLDLDGLKAINDTHGHLFGAYVISDTGKLIGRSIPGESIAARFGGDEYVVACPKLDLRATLEVAEAIHAAVNEHEFIREGVTLNPGISIGVTCFPEHAKDRETLFSCADRALYAAKRGGRNRACVYEL